MSALLPKKPKNDKLLGSKAPRILTVLIREDAKVLALSDGIRIPKVRIWDSQLKRQEWLPRDHTCWHD